ncbi:MAG: hypothetical protein DME08_03020 [Candidatus Rokuibacteriota bacterium]|nr:MAG: hypothetical protein DME08_03020 [Candidatus Rokubacteria bacterium]
MMARRHLIIGGGTAGMNAIRTIREEEAERSEITLVSAEKPYSRMVLPYYLDRSISESHVFTATAAVLAQWGAKTLFGRRAASLDTKANVCTLDDGTRVEYDDCLIATGSSAVKAPVPGADLRRRRAGQSRGDGRRRVHQLHDPELGPVARRQAHHRRDRAAHPPADDRRHRGWPRRRLADAARCHHQDGRPPEQDRGRQGQEAAEVRQGQ